LLDQILLSFGSRDRVLEQFPFLAGYVAELEAIADKGADLTFEAWRAWVYAWEEDASAHLPLRALRNAAGLDHAGLTCLMALGLIEEDGRFGAVFEMMQGISGQHRPTMALLNTWWHNPDGYME